ncbi:hypothetical protein [Amycolatopsis sp. NPDC004378]
MDEDYARKLRAWLRAEPEAAPRPADEREWLREIPEPGPAEGRWTPGQRLPEPGTGDERPTADRDPQTGSEKWSVWGQLPEADLDEEWVCPVIDLPIPRVSDENGCRMSDAEARSRWNHPSNWHRRRRAAADEHRDGNR